MQLISVCHQIITYIKCHFLSIKRLIELIFKNRQMYRRWLWVATMDKNLDDRDLKALVLVFFANPEY